VYIVRVERAFRGVWCYGIPATGFHTSVSIHHSCHRSPVALCRLGPLTLYPKLLWRERNVSSSKRSLAPRNSKRVSAAAGTVRTAASFLLFQGPHIRAAK